MPAKETVKILAHETFKTRPDNGLKDAILATILHEHKSGLDDLIALFYLCFLSMDPSHFFFY